MAGYRSCTQVLCSPVRNRCFGAPTGNCANTWCINAGLSAWTLKRASCSSEVEFRKHNLKGLGDTRLLSSEYNDALATVSMIEFDVFQQSHDEETGSMEQGKT